MNLLTPFRERLWHMFSPGKSPGTSPSKPPSPKTDPLHKIKKGRIERRSGRGKSLSPTVKYTAEESEESNDSDEEYEDYGDEEGDVVGDLHDLLLESEEEDSEAEPNPKRVKRSPRRVSKASDYEVDEEEEEPTADITQDEKDEYGIGITIEPVEHATLGNPDYEGWTQDELDLYNRLNDRGVVPLLHTSWQLDFPTIPEVLFTEDRNEAYIKSEKGTDFHGIKALSSLLQAGVRMRDRLHIAQQNPAPILARLAKKYITWSIKDVGLNEKRITPLVAVMAAPHSEAIQKTVTRMTSELQALAATWRAVWADAQQEADGRNDTKVNGTSAGIKRKREDTETLALDAQTSTEEPLPTLYGIVIARTIMAFVTYDAALEDSNVRNLALFNWRDPGQDVWNILAVALMIVQARETLVWLNDAGLVRRKARNHNATPGPNA